MVDWEAHIKCCYTCLKPNTGVGKYLKLDFSIPGDIPYTKKLKFCIPEMILNSVDDCILCKQCSIALDSAYLFRTMCLETESKLQLVRQTKNTNVEGILQEQDTFLNFSVVDVRTLSETEEGSEVTTSNIRAAGFDTITTTDSSVNCEKSLTDVEIIAKCCATMPVLKNCSPRSLQCWVVSEKVIPIKRSSRVTIYDSKLINEKNTFWCSICDIHIRGKSHYNFHLRMHLNIAFVCTSCSLNCISRKNLEDHKMYCTVKPVKPKIVRNITPQIPKVDKKKGIKRRIKNKTEVIKVKFNGKITAAIQRDFNCKICSFKTSLRSLLKRHNMSHVGNPPFHCKHCPKVFDNRKKFIRHMTDAKHSKPGSQPGKQRAKRRVFNIGPPPYECTTCSKVFKVAHKFLRHIREVKHTNLKKLQTLAEVKKEKHICDVCAMDFISEFELADHRQKLHLEAENCNPRIDVGDNNQSITTGPSNEYYCNLCKTKFKKLEFFFNHNCTVGLPEPIYDCHLCNMSFPERISLIEHMEVHFTITSETS